MTISLSNQVLHAMGFTESVVPGTLHASFMSVTVYEVRGIVVPKEFVNASAAQVAGVQYRLALAASVNEGCRAIIDDDFVDDEPPWCKSVKSHGPFALIAVGPTEYIECTAGQLMRDKFGVVTTFEGFPNLRETLQGLEHRVLPPVVAALTCALNEPDRYVSLRKLARESSGRSADGTHVHDIYFELKGGLYVSRALDESALAATLTRSTKRAPSMNQRAARFFWLGTSENDELKKFLYLFLALEIETHAAFARIDHQAYATSILSSESAPSPDAVRLARTQFASLKNLFDRFVWCANCLWIDISDEEIALFKRLKDARDDIAHGRASEPPTGFANSAQLLLHKVFWRW